MENADEAVVQASVKLAAAREALKRAEIEFQTALAAVKGIRPAASERTPGQQVMGAVAPLLNTVVEDMTLGERVLDFIRRKPNARFGARDVAEGIGVPEDKIPSVRSALFRLHKAGKIAGNGQGEFWVAGAQQPAPKVA
jgi:hypothetical protein